MKKKLTFDNNDMGCVIRKPLFSYDILFSSDNATCNLDDVVDVLLKNDEFVSSIYWSSSEVYDLIQLYKDGLLKDEHKIKLTNTLKKYAIRISTRTTPFGTFSGCSYNSNVEIANKGTYRRARIDMDLLQKIVLKIEDDKFINRNLRYTLNNTFYYDSLHILRKLKVDDLYLDEDKKIFSAIKDIDFYLSYFDFTLKEKMQFCKEMESAFEKEFTAKMKKHIYSQYREKEKKFNLFMKEDENHHFSKKEASEILLLSLKIENLPSYIHMSINRWFSSQQRAYEYLCYIFAQKYFNRIANLKYNASSTY